MSPDLAHPTAPRRTQSPLMPDKRAIDRFLAHCHRRRYPSRTDVFRPGDSATRCTT